MEKPICVDCKFCMSRINGMAPLCMRATDEMFDPVRGWTVISPMHTCSNERARPILFRKDRCGPDAQYFQQRAPLKPPTGGSGGSRPSGSKSDGGGK